MSNNIKIKTYTIARLLVGVSLVIHALLITLRFGDFLDKIEMDFAETSIFNYSAFYYLAPLSPFIEFAIGLLLSLGLYTKLALRTGFVLKLILTIFLLEVSDMATLPFHFAVGIALLALNRFINYNTESMDFRINCNPLI
jgi:thiosulfate dehydrogenase [quinone] large subunit